MEFEWDEGKRVANLAKYDIDFLDAARIFAGPRLVRPSPREEERRFIAVGLLDDICVAVVFTVRSGRLRIISARKARREERAAFSRRFGAA